MQREFGKCCESCQFYWTCELKWFRGERNEADRCCELCNYYNVCLRTSKEKGKKNSNSLVI